MRGIEKMNDRELLEYAAKAAGYEIHIWGTKGQESVARMDLQNRPRWNPLTDDGDALRLAVKCAILDSAYFSVSVANEAFKNNGDWLDATRRAIVRAAAEIGKSL